MQIYRGNGYRVPTGYRVGRLPYAAVLGTRARTTWEILDTSPANWDGDIIEMNMPGVPQPDGSSVAVTFGFHNGGAPIGNIPINVAGFATEAQYVNAIVTAMTTFNGTFLPTPFVAGPVDAAGGTFTLSYPLAGTIGNFVFHMPTLALVLRVNGLDNELDEEDPRFYDGAEFAIPLRFGRNYGFALGPHTPQSQPAQG